MNKEIKFRGMCIISGNWVYGDLIHGVGHKDGKLYILPLVKNLASVKHCDPLDGVEVDPKTIGQFTGLHDKSGKEIYEGDIIKDLLTNAVYLVKIGFCKKRAYTGVWGEDLEGYEVSINNDSDENSNTYILVIGNIYENHELLNP